MGQGGFFCEDEEDRGRGVGVGVLVDGPGGVLLRLERILRVGQTVMDARGGVGGSDSRFCLS